MSKTKNMTVEVNPGDIEQMEKLVALGAYTAPADVINKAIQAELEGVDMMALNLMALIEKAYQAGFETHIEFVPIS